MEKIASFTVNHDILLPGIYISREDRNTITYDIRLVRPNSLNILETGELHTIEHIVATYMRNSKFKDQIVYFGPMGCRTGCYLITFDDMLHSDAIELIQNAFTYLANYPVDGEIPGAKSSECGNYRDHDLVGAKEVAVTFLKDTVGWSLFNLNYPK